MVAETFPLLKHVFVVGVGGAVPDYTDFSRHVRRGDIVVSVPRTAGGSIYIRCEDVNLSETVNGGQPSYSTAVWSATDDFIQSVINQLADYTAR